MRSLSASFSFKVRWLKHYQELNTGNDPMASLRLGPKSLATFVAVEPLTSPHLWSRDDVVRGNRVVDVDEDTWIGRAVGSWERDQWRWGSASTVGNGKLGASNVKLSTSRRRGTVQANVLHAKEVITAGRGGGDSHVDRGNSCDLC
jgi:hypothetical protein